jgi:transposase
MYKARHLTESLFCKLNQYRATATRYDKAARNFLAAIRLAAAIIWSRTGLKHFLVETA